MLKKIIFSFIIYLLFIGNTFSYTRDDGVKKIQEVISKIENTDYIVKERISNEDGTFYAIFFDVANIGEISVTDKGISSHVFSYGGEMFGFSIKKEISIDEIIENIHKYKLPDTKYAKLDLRIKHLFYKIDEKDLKIQLKSYKNLKTRVENIQKNNNGSINREMIQYLYLIVSKKHLEVFKEYVNKQRSKIKVSKNLHDYIFNGPNYETWGCDGGIECSKKIIEDKENGKYDNINQTYIDIVNSFYEKFLFIKDLNSNSITSSERKKIQKELISKIDVLAKDILTDESYELGKIRNFSYFNNFLNSIFYVYYSIEEKKSEIENFTPLTKEQKELFINEYNKTGKLPELNDPKFDYLDGVDISFSNGEISFPEPEIEFPILVINDNRISTYKFGSILFIDFVKVNGNRKVDFIEPRRPDITKNPRIMIFKGGDGDIVEDLKRSWEKMTDMIK